MMNRQAMIDGLQGTFGSTADAARAWATAIVNGFMTIEPACTTVVSAKPALESALQTAFEAPLAAAGMETALAAFAATIGGGMTGFVPTPPPGPVGFATLFAPPFPETRADAAAELADKILDWAHTGSGTSGSGPLAWS